MRRSKLTSIAVLSSLALAPLTGCENVPGGNREQGTVVGGALGAGGGYLIGAQMNKTDPQHRDQAVQASKSAEANPATPEDVRKSSTADLNNDSYVTLDEVAAMQKAGLNDSEMINRLRATGQIFELTPQQEQYLRDKGVDQEILTAMHSMNQPTSTAQPAASTTGPSIGNQPISSNPR